MSETAFDAAYAAPESREVTSRVGVGRTSWGLFFAAVGLFSPLLGTSISLLPARLAEIAPKDSVTLLGVFAAVAALVSFLSALTFGTISDRTRSRLGRRNPWIVVGTVVMVAATVLLAFAGSVPVIGIAFLLQSVGANIALGTLAPVIPDRVPTARRGIASTALGAGTLIGGTVGVEVSSVFATNAVLAFLVLSAVAVVLVLVYQLLAPDFANSDDARMAGSANPFRNIRLPRNTPDFYWAFFGRFGVILGYYSIGSFQFFVLTQYLHLDTVASKQLLGTAAVVNLVGSLIGALVAGPLSDLIRRRKAVTIASAVIIGIAVVVPLVVPSTLGFLIYTGVAGLGLGMFFSVDAALMSQLLPSSESRGKDLSILGLATNAGQLLGPLIGSLIVGIGLGFPPVFVIALIFCLVGGALLLPIRSVQ